MKKLVNLSLILGLTLVSITYSSCNAQAPKANLKTDIDSLSYAQGVLQASELDGLFSQFDIQEENKAAFLKGFQESFSIKSDDKKANAELIGKLVGWELGTRMFPRLNEQLFGNDSTQTLSKNNFLAGYFAEANDSEKILISSEEAEEYAMKIVDKIRLERLEIEFAPEKKENTDFLADNKSQAGVVTLPSGLQYKVLVEGTGAKPSVTDKVKVHYHGTNVKGEVFDSSVERGEPIVFPLEGVINGWKEGLQQMPVGSKYILYVPYDLAYGPERRSDKIGNFATLIFEVELLGIEE